MSAERIRASMRERLEAERGTLRGDGPERVALVYPSPYAAGMSSLGMQTIYRVLHGRGRPAERAFLPDDVEAHRKSRLPLLTYESGRPVGDYPVVALSVAYELELAGVATCLELSGLPPLAEDRDGRHPIVLAGGPLTFSNPLPLGAFADVILMGECEETIHEALDALFDAGSKDAALEAIARAVPSAFVPRLHGDQMPKVAKAPLELLPAYAPIRTPNTELRDMFLVEAERGCSRGCTYCVMRRSTNGGMRLVPMETILGLVPPDARRVGLVGAAVSDHPKIAEIVDRLADGGREVGLSSLRADRLDDRLAAALRKAGARTLTTAADGASERMRDLIQRKTRERHLVRAAELVRAHGLERLKLYVMLGLPGETDQDVDELVRLASELSRIAPLSLGIAPFVSKRQTPLDGEPFAGVPLVEARLGRLRGGLKGRVEIRSTSARWAWIEWVLAQGGIAEGKAVLAATAAGGRFADYKRAFEALPEARPRRALSIVA